MLKITPNYNSTYSNQSFGRTKKFDRQLREIMQQDRTLIGEIRKKDSAIINKIKRTDGTLINDVKKNQINESKSLLLEKIRNQWKKIIILNAKY